MGGVLLETLPRRKLFFHGANSLTITAPYSKGFGCCIKLPGVLLLPKFFIIFLSIVPLVALMETCIKVIINNHTTDLKLCWLDIYSMKEISSLLLNLASGKFLACRLKAGTSQAADGV